MTTPNAAEPAAPVTGESTSQAARDAAHYCLEQLRRIQGWEDPSDADEEQSSWSVYQRTIEALEGFEQAALASTQPRSCTCHPDDNPPRPCPRKYALNDCRAAARLASSDALREAAQAIVTAWERRRAEGRILTLTPEAYEALRAALASAGELPGAATDLRAVAQGGSEACR